MATRKRGKKREGKKEMSDFNSEARDEMATRQQGNELAEEERSYIAIPLSIVMAAGRCKL
eukprot:scaffold632902_cov161-Attheya_sp.AAC.1